MKNAFVQLRLVYEITSFCFQMQCINFFCMFSVYLLNILSQFSLVKWLATSGVFHISAH